MGEMPNFTGAQAARLKHNFHTQVGNSVKSALSVERRQKWEDHVRSLTVQGHNLALAAAEEQDLVWKSFMYDLKQGTLKFLLNADKQLQTSKDGRSLPLTYANCVEVDRPRTMY